MNEMTRDIAALTEEIREVVDAYPVIIRGPALAYELAAAIAEGCPDPTSAERLLAHCIREIRHQWRTCGLGRRHP